MNDLHGRLRANLEGRYAIDRELGRGGMATVFLGRDLRHDRPVAIKVLHPELGVSLGGDRFLREIQLCARLQHPHILTVHDSGEVPGNASASPLLWFTMPYIEGESLRDRLRREKQLPVDDALRITRETADALDYAHRHGVIHRDIKPENILLSDGHALVADFGIGKALGAATAAEKLTETGMVVGTPAYMSPEQASGERELDGRTDVYSFGAALYEMLAGEPPYTGATAQQIIVKRFTDPVPSVRSARPSVSEAVDQAIRKALAPVAADRYASAAEFAAALRGDGQARDPAPPAVVGTAQSPARSTVRLPRRPLTAALGLGFLLGLGVLFAWRRGHGDPASADGERGPRRVAVVPFENLGDSTDAYFAEGVTDAVRGKLTALPGLAVTARASSVQYRGAATPIQQIGHELGVDYVLTGTVRWEKSKEGASRVQVSPELIEVTTARAKWQQLFNAALTDVFQVQAQIAGNVAEALNLALAAPQKESLKERPTANLAAYDAFLKGEAISQTVGIADPPRLREAIKYYEQAVALDATFLQAWAQLARAAAIAYYNGTPASSGAEQARHAAERAAALGPGRPEAQLALGDYLYFVRRDVPRADAAYQEGLKVAPRDAALLTGSTITQQSLGDWDGALATVQRAQVLDPRAVFVARRLAVTLLRLRRYPEALAASDHGLAIAPDNLQIIETKAMVHLGQGDLASARRVLREASDRVEPTALAAYVANYWDLFWVLQDDQQQLVLRLAPSAFDDDRASWGLVMAQTWHLRGNDVRARAYADSARVVFEEQLAATPNEPQLHILRGLALAYLGRKAEAIAEGERGTALAPITVDGYTGPYLQHQLARIYTLTGEYEKALDRLEPLLKIPYHLSRGWLQIDPGFDPIRKHPRFQALVAAGATT